MSYQVAAGATLLISNNPVSQFQPIFSSFFSSRSLSRTEAHLSLISHRGSIYSWLMETFKGDVVKCTPVLVENYNNPEVAACDLLD
jgi:hypothetical protein